MPTKPRLLEPQTPLFTNRALQELPATPWRIPLQEIAARRDIRSDHRACSIDPPGSKDVDDVLSVKWLSDGTAEVGSSQSPNRFLVHVILSLCPEDKRNES
jgi:protein SSD1